MTLYKATRPDGTDFLTGTIDYGAALVSGEVIRHPAKRKRAGDASTYLSASDAPGECTGMAWPCRLFVVEPVGRTGGDPDLPHKVTMLALRVIEERPAHEALGPNGEAVAAFIERCRTMTPEQARKVGTAWAAAWDAARDAAGAAAWDAAWDAAGYAARAAAGDAAGDAARAILVRDLITPEQYAVLTQPFRDAGLGAWVA